MLCYCLMPNHFHLLVYQVNDHAMQRLMRGVMTAYSRYFNKKYRRSGSLFESRYKASRISGDYYLMHITRYIHLNPSDWRHYPYSSLQYYLQTSDADWLQEGRILDLFSSREKYSEFVEDYESVKESLALIRDELASDEE
ncbi:MAG: transposase [Candidatus Microsaccharimonas sp.]